MALVATVPALSRWQGSACPSIEEAAPVAAHISARTVQDQLNTDLEHARGERVATRMPEGATQLKPRDLSRTGDTGTRIAIDGDGTLLFARRGDPDMLDSYYAYVVRISDPALIERARQYIAAN